MSQAAQANSNISRRRESFYSAWKERAQVRNKKSLVPPVPLVPVIPDSLPLFLPGKTWTAEDEYGLPKCKHCKAPLVWGRLEEFEPDMQKWQFVKKSGPERFRPLDPDLSPHACEYWKMAAAQTT